MIPALKTGGRILRWGMLPMAAALILALGSSPADADHKRHKQWNQGWGKHSQNWDDDWGWGKRSKHRNDGWGWGKRSNHWNNNGWGWGRHSYYPRQRYNYYQYYYSPGPSYFPPPAYYYPRDRYYKRNRYYDEPGFQIILPFRFD